MEIIIFEDLSLYFGFLFWKILDLEVKKVIHTQTYIHNNTQNQEMNADTILLVMDLIQIMPFYH